MKLKILLLLPTLFIISCDTPVNKKTVISKITKDNLIIEQVDIIQESTYYNVITDLDITIKSSISAWNNSPELGQYNRVKTIEKVTKNFLKKLDSVKYEDNDKVIAYRFIKSYKNKKYVGYTVIIFDKNGKQFTLYYNIKRYPSAYDNSISVKQLINKGLSDEINKIEKKYYKKVNGISVYK
jgi:hypothetical protein